MAGIEVRVGDIQEQLARLPNNVFDAVLCDPPYGLGFMGHSWDGAVPSALIWREIMRVCKPGAHLLAFGGTRTFHRLAVAIEDGGWELRDTLMWLYGQGFPKSQNVAIAIDKEAGVQGSRGVGVNVAGRNAKTQELLVAGAVDAYEPKTPLAKAFNGYGTALKPAWEPIALARKALDGTTAENVAKWGIGGLAIDACRIETDWSDRSESWKRSGNSAKPDAEKIAAPPGTGIRCHEAGRWPANLILDEEAGAALDAQSGELQSHGGGMHPGGAGFQDGAKNAAYRPLPKGDTGGASRFFYSPKASRAEREAGCDALPLASAGEATGGREEGSAGLESPRAGASRGGGARNHHPTLKPIALTTYLAKLILQPTPGRLLVPFSGSGSEMIGALHAGWAEVVGIERSEEYAEIARARLAHALRQLGLTPRPIVLPDRWQRASPAPAEASRQEADEAMPFRLPRLNRGFAKVG